MMTLTSSEFMFSSSDAILNEFNNQQSQYYFCEFQQALISRSLGVEGREFFYVSPLLCKRCLMRSEKQIFLYYTVRIAVTSPSFVDTLASRFTLDCVVPRSAEYLQTPGTAECRATVGKLHTVPQLGMAGTVTGTHRPGHQQPEHHKS